MSLHRDSIDLVKKIEIWISKLRYKDEKIDEEIPIEILSRLDGYRRGVVIHSNLFGIIKSDVEWLKTKGHEPTEEIKNRILMIETFRQNELGCTPSITYGSTPSIKYDYE